MTSQSSSGSEAQRRESLQAEHEPEVIAARIAEAKQHSYLGDYVLGAVDGTVTTFAIVAGAAGAGLSGGVAVVLGLANVAADGFSMAASNYLKATSDRQIVERLRRQEERHIREIPDGEREEIRQIFAAKGLDGDILESVVDVITQDRRQWVDTMITEEFGMSLEQPDPWRSAVATFLAFVAAGLMPLAPMLLAGWLATQRLFAVAAGLTAVTFLVIGVLRGVVVEQPRWRSGLETVVVGGTAALAYVVGAWLHGWA